MFIERDKEDLEDFCNVDFIQNKENIPHAILFLEVFTSPFKSMNILNNTDKEKVHKLVRLSIYVEMWK